MTLFGRVAAFPIAALVALGSVSVTNAQQAPPPEIAAEIDALIAIERMRADFRARFLDYDRRLEALNRRIELLEAERDIRARFNEMDFDQSAATMPAEGDEANNAPEAAGADPDEVINDASEGAGDAADPAADGGANQ